MSINYQEKSEQRRSWNGPPPVTRSKLIGNPIFWIGGKTRSGRVSEQGCLPEDCNPVDAKGWATLAMSKCRITAGGSSLRTGSRTARSASATSMGDACRSCLANTVSSRET